MPEYDQEFEFDRELVLDIISDMLWAIDLIQKRFSKIDAVADFLEDDRGMEILDSICMQLINIGEALKNIDKITNRKLLINYPQVKWKNVMGMRDVITHHYFDIDAEIVFNTCDRHMARLKSTLNKIKSDIESS